MTDHAAASTDGDASTSPDAGHHEDSQRRLQDLLIASTSIVERLDLEVVLRRIVEAGMKLVGARYGALGVISREGTLERFIHVGMEAQTVAQIGHLPTGRGVLGAVITDREPIRLEHLADDPRSTGFPDHHPTMDSFLGVPVRVGDQVYGNLYLTEGSRGPFTEDDQGLIVALAATAGIAIENARLYDTARTREVWNATIADVMAAMLDVEGESALDVIAERVAALIDAELVAVATPHGEDEFVLATVHGAAAAELRGRSYLAAGTLTARALETRRAVGIAGQPAAAMFDWQPDVGPTVAIPLFAGDEPLGVLTVSRRAEGAAFNAADLEMAFAFATQASIALEIVRAREDRRRLDTNRDRARIARDLHDHVIQRLFGAGLALQAVSATADSEVAEGIESQIDVIDSTIRDIRTIIFALGSGERLGVKRLRDRLLDVVADVTDSWAIPPRISFSGPLDSVVSPGLTDDLVAVLRELLTNIGKHANAHNVEIAVGTAEADVELVVRDDGAGIPASVPRSGLANIADRARLRGGGCEVASAPGAGTRIRWTAPIDHEKEAER